MRAATANGEEAGPDSTRAGRRLEVRGQVQGVGFRPFVYRLAGELALGGSITNTSFGVCIEVEGETPQLDRFVARLQSEHPALAAIDQCAVVAIPCSGRSAFSILESDRGGAMQSFVLPDVATCSDCLREMNDPHDRRYRYPFTNCTNCGPRYSIIQAMPYDRPFTTMAQFTMCDACRREYGDPADRRFHAQPIACPACGPRLSLWDGSGATRAEEGPALAQAVEALEEGAILALKGLGGFQLAVDAGNESAVRKLRHRKQREGKPFALMFPDLDAIVAACAVQEAHARLLRSPQAPIVLIPARNNATTIAPSVAPDTYLLGAMLPYTPLHHLLLSQFGRPLVLTSGNRGEEPICIDNNEALHRLRGIADLFLVHDRPIARQVDDAMVTVVRDRAMVLRRARGYAPSPINRKGARGGTLAVGGHLKNTVSFVKDGAIFPSQHIGNLENVPAMEAFERTIESMTALFEVVPTRVVHDRHPDYASTQFALGLGLPATPVQHHYAHVLSCMAEHDLAGPVLGVSWDGTGHGDDGTIWGGEFLLGTRAGFERVGSLRPFQLPGGDEAARDTRRPALSLLLETFGGNLDAAAGLPLLEALAPRERTILQTMLKKGVNAPVTTSAGRLFDAVAGIIGLCYHNTFEGQAAMRLEREAVAHAGPALALSLALERGDGRFQLDWRGMIRDIVQARLDGVATGAVAKGFHNALVSGIVALATAIGEQKIVLTGGCFQNALLLDRAQAGLEEAGFEVFMHHAVPPNDGGISVGQAWYQPEGE